MVRAGVWLRKLHARPVLLLWQHRCSSVRAGMPLLAALAKRSGLALGNGATLKASARRFAQDSTGRSASCSGYASRHRRRFYWLRWASSIARPPT